MKRDQFIVALHEDIKEKVDDKEPGSFERAKEVTISKWRKRMKKFGRDMREYDEAIEGVTPHVLGNMSLRMEPDGRCREPAHHRTGPDWYRSIGRTKM